MVSEASHGWQNHLFDRGIVEIARIRHLFNDQVLATRFGGAQNDAGVSGFEIEGSKLPDERKFLEARRKCIEDRWWFTMEVGIEHEGIVRRQYNVCGRWYVDSGEESSR